MKEYMDAAIAFLSEVDPLMLIPFSFIAIIGVIGQWMLYEKANLKGVACIVPIWNVMEFMKIMGRPSWHAIFIMAPPPLIAAALYFLPGTAGLAIAAVLGIATMAFVIKVYIELCHAFGRTSPADYVLVLIFNGLYVLWLGLSEVKYRGPVYGQKKTVATSGTAAAATA